MMKNKNIRSSAGFTLVEIAVIAPIVVLVITGILVVLINFISNNAITSSRLALANDVHASLGDMEDKLSPAQSFTDSVSSSLNLQNANSTDYSSRPHLIGITTDEVGTGNNTTPALADCNQSLSEENLRPTATVYFVDSSNNLKRRVLTKSSAPCGGTSVNPTNCRAANTTSNCADDTILATNVTDMIVKYCVEDTCTTSNSPDEADSADVSITATKTVAGKTLTTDNSLRVSLLGKFPPPPEDEGGGDEGGGGSGGGTTCPSNSTGHTDQEITGGTSGTIWGTDIYTNDSNLGKAAVHTGILDIGQTGLVRVCALPGQSSYTGSTQNGVTSNSYGSWGGSISLILLHLSCPSNSTSYTDQEITGGTSGTIWGTDIYTNDSNLGKAAVHAGILSVGETGMVRVCALPGQSSYTGSTRNGVTSNSYGSWGGSISLISLTGGGGGGSSGISLNANPDTISMSASYGSYNWPTASTLTVSNGTPPYNYEITPIAGEEDMLGLTLVDQSYDGCVAYQDSGGYAYVGIESDVCYGGLFDTTSSGNIVLGVYEFSPGSPQASDCYATNLLTQPSAFRVTVTDSNSQQASKIIKIYCDYWGYYNYDDDICNWYGSPICPN